MAQGYPVYVWAVEKIARSKTQLESIPNWLLSSGAHVEVVEDCGPITKLLPALRKGFETIIVADDDRIYGKGWAAGLLQWSLRLPDAVLSYGGRKITCGNYGKCPKVQCGKLVKPVQIDVPMGAYGILYKSGFFSESIFEDWKDCPLNDDLVVARHLRQRNVKCFVVPGSFSIKATETDKLKPLRRVNKGKNAKHKRNNKGLRVLGLWC